MLKFFWEPKWSSLPAGQATSSVITANTPIGRNAVAEEQVTGAHYCNAKGMFLDSWYMEATSKTIAYFDDNTLTWKTKSQLPYEQIVCDDGIYATTTAVTVSLASTSLTIDSAYNGLNYQEALFIGGVIIFFLSFIAWGRISFTNIKKI